MAYKPIRMDKIKKIIELHRQSVPKKKIARLLGVSKNTVKRYIKRIDQLPIGVDLDANQRIKQQIYGHLNTSKEEREAVLASQLSTIISELGRVGVTLQLLWQEYKEKHPEGYSYSRFCKKVKAYKARQDVTLRFNHKAGEVLSVDYAGKKISWVDRSNGEVHYCEVLVCTLPYSGKMFACAVPSQKQADFIHAINQSLKYIGGLPTVLQSDNLKSFVIRADRYEPTFSNMCIQFSSYYGVELSAARAGKPKDKAHVERHVNILYNQIYGPLRNEIFYSIEEINKSFIQRLDVINNKNYQGKEYSREDRFITSEQSHLRPLPSQLFEVKKSTTAKVQRNYHVILGEDKHQYSVPYIHVGKQSEISYTRDQVEIYIGNERIALHKRDRRNHGYSTLPIHMPEKHVKYWEHKGWDAAYFKSQSSQIGPDTLWAMTTILDSKIFIEQTYNACLGVLRLAKNYGPDRLEKACSKAQDTGRVNYGILKNILKNNMDKIPDESKSCESAIPKHDNTRGAKNYS